MNQLPIFTESIRKPTLCALCGRPLRDHQSITRQMGPRCWEKVLTVAMGIKNRRDSNHENHRNHQNDIRL